MDVVTATSNFGCWTYNSIAQLLLTFLMHAVQETKEHTGQLKIQELKCFLWILTTGN